MKIQFFVTSLSMMQGHMVWGYDNMRESAWFSVSFCCQFLSLFPARVLRLMEFLGFSGDRVRVFLFTTSIWRSWMNAGRWMSCESFCRRWVCLSWGRERPITASVPSSAPWLCWCFISMLQWFWVTKPKLQSQMCDLLLFAVKHCPYPSGTGEGNLTEAEALLEPYTKKFPNVSSLQNCLFSWRRHLGWGHVALWWSCPITF